MKIKKTLILILVFSLALGLLSACGGEGKDGENSLESDFVYLPEYMKLELGDENMSIENANAALGDKVFIVTAETQESDEDAENHTYNSVSYIYSFDINNPKPEKLPAYEPILNSKLGDREFNFVSSDIENMAVDKDGNIYILESYYISGSTAEGESENASFLRKLDSTGKEILRVESEKIKGSDEEGYDYIQNIVASPEGNLCLIVDGEGSRLIFTDENLSKTGEKSLSDMGWISDSVGGADGKCYLMYYGKEDMVISEVDFEAKDIKPAVSIDRHVYKMYAGGGGSDFMAADSANLYAYNAETGKSEFVLGFTNSGVDMVNLKLLAPLENGDIFALTDKSMVLYSGGGMSSDEGNEYEMIYLRKTARSEAPQVQKITLAGTYIDGVINQKILEFNKKSSDLKIEVKDYSVFNSGDDYSAGETKLLTEIGAGNVPDILCSFGPQQSFIKKGLFIDLLPLIDADEELGGREALFEPVINASLVDGKLYSLSGGFSHLCCITSSDLISDKIVSLDAAKAAKEKLKENATYFDWYMDGSAFINMAMLVNRDDFIDFKNGKTMFESQKFIDLLNFAKEMPTPGDDMMDMEYEDPVIKVRDGKQLFALLHNSADLAEYRMAYTLLNGKINFCSFPGSDKVFSAFAPDSGLSISSSCKNPELAWKFVRTLVSDVETYDEGSVYGSLPMNAKSFDNLIKKLMEKEMVEDENGNEIEVSNFGMGTGGGETIDIYALTAEQRDMLLKVFEDTTIINEPDSKLLDIIGEETEAFLNGDKTAEETAKIIQNRASIYVSEMN